MPQRYKPNYKPTREEVTYELTSVRRYKSIVLRARRMRDMKLAKDKAERIYRMLIGDPSGLGNSKRFTEDGEGYSYTLYLGTLDQDEVDSLLSMIRTLCPSWTRIEPKHQPRSYKKEREEKAKKAEMVSEYWDAEELTPASAEYF